MILKPETKTRETIRSYVVRAGRITSGQKLAIDELWPHVGRRVADGPYISGNPNKPLIMDIGFGMGQSLVEIAARHPDNEYIGVEVYPPGVGSCLAQMQNQQVDNIRIYCADVMLVLENCLAENALAGVQIFFPDPWHKRRHLKRRLIQPAFLDLLSSRLQNKGFLHIATDWAPYAAHCQKVLAAHPRYVISRETTQTQQRPTTKFEKRGVRLGHEVVDLLANCIG